MCILLNFALVSFSSDLSKLNYKFQMQCSSLKAAFNCAIRTVLAVNRSQYSTSTLSPYKAASSPSRTSTDFVKIKTNCGDGLNKNMIQSQSPSLCQQQCTRQYSIHEPDYLQTTGPEVYLYDLLNIQVTGYDFSILESFAKYVHHTAERLGIDVEDSWALPCKKMKVTQLKPETIITETEYQLNLYERNVQIADVPSTILPLLVNIIEVSLPAGVKLKIYPHVQIYSDLRFVPDLKLKELRTELDTMRSDREKERDKK